MSLVLLRLPHTFERFEVVIDLIGTAVPDELPRRKWPRPVCWVVMFGFWILDYLETVKNIRY